MITTTSSENEIISRILKTVFSSEATVCGIQVHDITVVIITPYALYSLGKDYFRELVQRFKVEAVQETAQAELNQYIEVQADAIAKRCCEAQIAPEQEDRGTGRRQPQTVTLVSKELIKDRSIMPQYLTEWVVIGETGNTYQLSWDTRTKTPTCSCRAAQFNHKCYHSDAVLNEWKRLEDARRMKKNQVLLDRLQRSVFDQSFQNRNKRLGAY